MSDDDLTIGHLGIGEQAIVMNVDASHTWRQRLLDMGFTPGSPLKIIRRAPFGDPIQVQIRHTHFAIRKADARFIKVSRG